MRRGLAVVLDLAAETARPAPVRPSRDSAGSRHQRSSSPAGLSVTRPARLDIAAHGAQVAMAGVAHDVLIAHALAIGFGDEADAQRMRAQPVEPVDA